MHDTPARTATVADSTSATFTAAGVRRGMALAIPFGGSSLIYGLGFGVLASQMGLSVAEAVVMGALVFSGTAQFAVVQAWGTGPALVAVFATVLVANARYFLMSAALRPWLGSLGRVNAVTALVILVDGAFAIGMRERAAGERDAGVLLGAALPSYIAWPFASGLGFTIGRFAANPKIFALDFILIAFCASAAALMWNGGKSLLPALAAIAAAAITDAVVPGAWAIVAAGIAGFAMGVLCHRSPAP